MLYFIFCLLILLYPVIIFIKNKKTKFLLGVGLDVLILLLLYFLNYKNNLILILFVFFVINFVFYLAEDKDMTLNMDIRDLVFVIINLAIIVFFTFFIFKNFILVNSFGLTEYEIFFLFVLLITFYIFVYYILLKKAGEQDV